MHACIILTIDESPDHAPPLPVIDLPDDPAGDARIWFLDAEGNQIVLTGCRACLADQFAGLARALGGPQP